MILYSRPDDPAGHAIRLVLAEKGVGVEVIECSEEAPPEDLLDLNPYGTMPTLVARDVTLYDPRIIAEYLDERYPHPPLLPPDPVLRARMRLFINEVADDWYALCDTITGGTGRERTRARRELTEAIVASDEIFAAAPFLLSENFGLADCSVLPLLWRLPHLGIQLPRESRSVRAYMQRLFRRQGFGASLTARERAMAGG